MAEVVVLRLGVEDFLGLVYFFFRRGGRGRGEFLRGEGGEEGGKRLWLFVRLGEDEGGGVGGGIGVGGRGVGVAGEMD